VFLVSHINLSITVSENVLSMFTLIVLRNTMWKCKSMNESMKTCNTSLRPRKVRVTVSLDEDVLQYLDSLSKNTGRNRSQFLNDVFSLGKTVILSSLTDPEKLAELLGFKSSVSMKRKIDKKKGRVS